jgi:hypothetical protein
MVSFIDAHRGAHGVEPICDGLPIAPSSYYDHRAKRSEPARLSDRVRRDDALRPEIRRVFEENWGVSGVRKVGSFAQRYVKRHAPVREGLKPAVYAGLCPSISSCDFKAVFEGRPPTEFETFHRIRRTPGAA